MDGAAPATRISATDRPALAGVRNDRARRGVVDSHTSPGRQRADCVTYRGEESNIVGATPAPPECPAPRWTLLEARSAWTCDPDLIVNDVLMRATPASPLQAWRAGILR